MNAPSSLGIDIGNAKIKLCLARPGEAPRWTSRPLPYDDRRRYARYDDFERGIHAALNELLGEGESRVSPDVAVCVTSSGYAYPSYREGVIHTAKVLDRALPTTRSFLLSATLELVPTARVLEGDRAVVGPIAFSNPNGAAWLTRRLGLLGSAGYGLSLDTGGSTTGTLVLAGNTVDPAALADPARHLDHRIRHGKLAWIGAETTPLEYLAREVVVDGSRLPVIPRGVLFQCVSVICELFAPERARKLSLFGLLPRRDQALRALADAVNLDLEMTSEASMLELARHFHQLAIQHLVDELGRAIDTAPEGARDRAAVWGLGATSLARPALIRAGLQADNIVVAESVLGPELAEAASCFGACHAGLELASGGPVPVFGVVSRASDLTPEDRAHGETIAAGRPSATTPSRVGG